jgi:hypothetical protein
MIHVDKQVAPGWGNWWKVNKNFHIGVWMQIKIKENPTETI